MFRNRVVRGLVAHAATALALLALVATVAGAQTVIPIAQIQANPASFVSQSVTVEGNVTVPINYRGPTFYSGYIQDGSGAGINVFGGSTAVPNASALNTVGNLVRVTGEVAIFSVTTIELVNVSDVTFVGAGTAPPPIHLTTLAANDARWEGTMIEVAGNVVSSAATGATARNYTVNDGSGPTTARVYTSLGIPQVADTTPVIGRGAGTAFNGTFEFYVGQTSDFVAGTPPADTQPPLLVGAWAGAATALRVTFNEAVDPTTGGNAANYQVFETANPGNTVAVGSVAVAGPVSTLTLSGSLVASTGYTVRVSNVKDTANNAIGTPITLAFTSPAGSSDTTPPTLASASALSLTSVRGTFSEAIDPTTGGNAANYSVFLTSNPSTTFAVSAAAVSGTTVTLTLGSSLAAGTGYTLRAQNVQDLATNAMVGQQSATFTTAGGGGAVPIADIHANLSQYLHTSVTVQGQVYIPSNYRSPATTISGYIQDSSGRGINLFGSSANNPLLQDLGNIVTVTGTVDTFSTTTVEILNLTSVTLVSGGNAPLQATHVTTGAAANAQWEGTYVETSGPITSVSTTAGASPAQNYTINDGSGPVVVRVINSLGTPTFTVGQTITGRGAGSHFRTDYQILVGKPADVFLGSGSDTTPPTLVSASATSLTSVRATFSEAIDTLTGGSAANYTVFETANPGNAFNVMAAAVSGINATLTLGSSLTAGTNYTLRAQSVKDLASNTMVGQQTATFTASSGGGTTPIASIHANLSQYLHTSVTVQGQVYITSNYRSPATTISGYIQDGSGRGINLFGSTANNPLLQDPGNIVMVTGTVDTFSVTTVEILNLTSVSLISGGNAPLQPTHLSTGAAANAQWEGTYIETSGPISSVSTTAGASPAQNYTVNDASGPVVIRVINSLGAPTFTVGQTITGRGAGSHFRTDYQILVGSSTGVVLGSGGGDTTPPAVVSATAPTATSVAVTLSEAVTTPTGTNVANWAVFETANQSATVPVTSATLSTDRRIATLALGGTLVDLRSYTVRASALTDDANNTMTATSSTTFTRGGGPTITPIATIQANPAAFVGQIVNVQGQVYVPSNYRGTTTSGYIQDDSGRGINIFGSGGNVPALQSTANIARVTGSVLIFGGTTVEVTNITQVVLVSGGHPPLVPTVLTTKEAANTAWEGTYILTTGTILAKVTQTAAVNYTIDDGSGPVVVRVVTTVPAPSFNIGQLVTGRGAGSQFNADFQILIGEASAIFEGRPVDTFPPSITRAATSGNQLTVTFNEPVSSATAQVPANYEVFRTNDPASQIAVTAAQLTEPAKVVLTLASSPDVALGYTLRVRNVADALGNAISPTGVTRTVEAAPAETVSVSGPKNTFLPRQGENYPITFTVTSDVASGNGEVLVRIFDLRGQLKRTLFDSKAETNPFPSTNRLTRTWDGRDDVAQLVPAGTYVVHLLVTPKRTGGGQQQSQIPVVVATRLER